MNLLKKIALREVRNKAKELHNKGRSVDEIVKRFLEEPKVVEGLAVLGVDEEELKNIVEKEIN